MIQRSLNHTLLQLTKTSTVENLSVEVTINQRRVVITTAYSPRYTGHFKDDVVSLTPTYKEFILLGDLNAKHPSWNCVRSNSAGNILNDLQQSRNFFIHNTDSPTLFPHQRQRNASTVDLVLSNSTLTINVKALGYEIPSDHRPVLCTIECSSIKTTDLSKNLYKLSNWRLYKNEISQKNSHK